MTSLDKRAHLTCAPHSLHANTTCSPLGDARIVSVCCCLALTSICIFSQLQDILSLPYSTLNARNSRCFLLRALLPDSRDGLQSAVGSLWDAVGGTPCPGDVGPIQQSRARAGRCGSDDVASSPQRREQRTQPRSLGARAMHRCVNSCGVLVNWWWLSVAYEWSHVTHGVFLM